MSELAVAAILVATVLVASTISVEVGLSVALIELALGVIVGNAFSLDVPGWLSFVGSFAGIVLVFLAGAEVDVPQFKREWRSSLWVGGISFTAPFLAVMAFAYWGLGWTREQAEIAGIALSTTSLAVVYAVLVETGLNRTVVPRSSSSSRASSCSCGSATGRTRTPSSRRSCSASSSRATMRSTAWSRSGSASSPSPS